MGARKQRWSEVEEKTLKAGIQKHGAGKWTAILKDPEFKSVLYSRSNVDLKDKYRNMNTVRNGEGSREKTVGAPKGSKQNQMEDKNHVTFKNNNDKLINEMNDVKLLTSANSFELSCQSKQKSSLELFILEAVACLKETGGSCVASIASYIVDNLKVVPDSDRGIGENLKALVEAGKLIKVNNRYKIAQNADLMKCKSPKVKPIEARKIESVKSYDDLKNVSKSSNNVRLSRSEDDLKNVSKSSMNEGLSSPKGYVNVNISEVNEGLPTYEDRTAHEAAEAVAKAEGLKAEYGEALRQLKLAEAFVSASHSLLEKLSMEMSRRNARMKEADMSRGHCQST